MKLHIDRKTRKIIGYTLRGNPVDENCDFVEVDMKEEDITQDLFFSTFENGKIILDETLKEDTLNEERKQEIRERREVECFPVINRGSIWYTLNINTATKLKELTEWYVAWLNATKTLEIPEMPKWLKDIL